MTSIINDKIITFLRQKGDFKVFLMIYDIRAFVLLNLSNSLRKKI